MLERHPDLIALNVTTCVRGHGSLAKSIELPQLHPALRPGLTVAVCTYRRPHSLGRFLESVAAQTRIPDEVLVIDASPDSETEALVCGKPMPGGLGDRLLYVRVSGALRGLTRQRNVALSLTQTDLVAFFDDDIVLTPDCLRVLELTHRTDVASPAGVAACIVNERTRPSARWRIRRLLGIVPTLTPGRYCRSGMSVPWAFEGATEAVIEGDWLPGGVTMWRTEVARDVGFYEGFRGYSNGEDLEFSLRVRAWGPLVMAGRARVEHIRDTEGRPDSRAMAYDSARNAYFIHRTCLRPRSWLDGAYFAYAFTLDTALLLLATLLPGVRTDQWSFVQGRVAFLLDLARKRLALDSEEIGG